MADAAVRPDPSPRAPDLARLRDLIRLYTPYDAEFPLRIPGVAVARSTQRHEALVHSVQQPALCIVAQGNKSVHIGAEQYEYDTDHMMVYAVNLPIAFQVTNASLSEPFLTFKVDLDPHRIAELTLKLYPHGLSRSQDPRGVQITDVNAAIIQTAVRILETVEHEREARWIGPMLVDELLMRLLLSPAGPMVAQLGQVESKTERVARAIEWIQNHLAEPLTIEVLAEQVHMGLSTFHAQFKAVTGLSPLQFQKNLRLQEARRLLVATVMDAGAVSREVGYASASQFTREYTRFFGNTPRRDMVHLRAGSSGLMAN
ncbi:AraC family transcriptional regulator (plasmid) [Deinococcus sp. KNUC1210]|uniref:AraC family transcriptional regulator n=1 Tax=Deinococcus sp. KNUC1210 TaxID=2917691 RepID=UPI001EEFC5B4|nr:AraC family transcriptional regulator [Deinococcus sp. KNUC1210]ULH17948.1 AraC family transcriptional regulator [Deinococcus sp. KNUC1210]